MTNADSLVRYSEMDSSRFGKRICRAEFGTPEEVQTAIANCLETNVDMLVARCSVARLEVAQALECAGATLMDTLVYFALRRHVRTQAPMPGTVRRYVDSDQSSLEEVARAAFTGYVGHYHADHRLDPDQATDAYVDWIRNCVKDPTCSVLVASRGQQPEGFLALRRTKDRAEITLNAVHPNAQGNGLYDALIKAALVDCADRADARLVVSTQLQNWAPQRVWVRNGFEPLEAYYTFHRWFS